MQSNNTKALTDFPFVTIVVPARNEANNIRACLDSIFKQDYPNYEVIVADDHSTDETAEIVKQTKARLLLMKDYPSNTVVAFKKRAIEAAISISSGEIIVTTDAEIINTVPISGCAKIRRIGTAATAKACNISRVVGSSESCPRSERIIEIPKMIEILASSAG